MSYSRELITPRKQRHGKSSTAEPQSKNLFLHSFLSPNSPGSAHDPSFQRGTASALSTASKSQDPHVVVFLLVFLAGLGLATYFFRVQKTTANILPDPIPATESKGTWKMVGLGVCVLAVGLVVLSALGGVVRAE
jgi:hypothetical protein